MRSEAEVRRALERAGAGKMEMMRDHEDERFIAVQGAMCDALGWVLGAINTSLGRMLEDAEAKDRAQRQ